MFIVEGVVKVKAKKIWKQRWCVLETIHNEDNELCTIIATISKIDDSSQRRKPMTHHHKVVKLPNFCGIHSGFVQDKEPNTLALVSTDNILVLALPDKCSLHSWISDLKSCTDFGECYDMFMVEAPKSCKNASAHFIKLYITADFLTAVSLSPVRYITSWRLSSVEEFGLRNGDRFFLKACTLNGKGGEFVFQSSLVVDLARAMTNRLKCHPEQLAEATMPLACAGSASSGSRRSSATCTSRLTQPLNFYEDMYMRKMHRNSIASTTTNSSQDSVPETKTPCECKSSTRTPRPATVFVTPLQTRRFPTSAKTRTDLKCTGIYDVPPSRQTVGVKTKCGIYDIPPSRKLSTSNAPATPTSTTNYDVVPPPRRVYNCSSDYDTPPTPKLVKNRNNTSGKVTDASPRCKADYNLPLQYVDLSQYDGCTSSEDNSPYISDNSKPLSSHQKFSRSKSCDTSAATYDTPRVGRHLSSAPLYDNIKLQTVTSCDVVLRKPIVTSQSSTEKIPSSASETNNLEKMRKIAKSADSLHAFAKHELSIARPVEEIDATSNSYCDLNDDGYVLVSENAVVKPHPDVKLRADKTKPGRRQHSIDDSVHRCSTDSGRVTCSNASLFSGHRESCSSYSEGSHLSLSSPVRSVRTQSITSTPKDSDWLGSPNYVNTNQLESQRDCSPKSGWATPNTTPSDINYADLDLELSSLSSPSKAKGLSSPKSGSHSVSCKHERSEKTPADMEYVMINIVATEAARKASKEQTEYRISKHAVSAH